MKTLECQYGLPAENCTLVGYLKFDDASFSHEFGVKDCSRYELESFHILVEINGFWEEIEPKSPITLEHMKEYFLKYAEERLAYPCVA